MISFDLAVIGAGPGGFEAALRARELGFKVALIEKQDPGGTCLNTGCIPTKAFLASTRLLTKIKAASSYGLSVGAAGYERLGLVERKNRIVETLKKGMVETLKRAGVEWISGEARLVGKNQLVVNRRGNPPWLPSGQAQGPVPTNEVKARWILIATGAVPTPFPGVPFDGETILSSTDLLELKTVPKRLLIIGGGVIGVEFASMFEPLGSQVMIVEMLERLIVGEDEEVSRRLESLFRRKGIQIHTGKKLQSLTVKADGVEAIFDSSQKLEADQVLVAMGRTPQIETLGLEAAGIKTENGAISVDDYLETSAAGIFAIGDVTDRTTGLAHGASAEGIRVVENLKGPKLKMDYGTIPYCIYTDPEVASVGATPRGCPQGRRRGLPLQEIMECKILFASLGKPHIEGETEGFLKMAASKKDGRILGVTAIGAHVTELIHEAALAVKAGLKVETMAQTIHAHPTESEVLQKAAEKLFRSLQG